MNYDLLLHHVLIGTANVCIIAGCLNFVVLFYLISRNKQLNAWMARHLLTLFKTMLAVITVSIAVTFLPLPPLLQIVLVGLFAFLAPTFLLVLVLMRDGIPGIRRRLDIDAVVKELQAEYPGKNIILSPPENPTEIICELERTNGYSKIIAVTEKSEPHYHLISTEHYKVLRGRLVVYTKINGKTYREVLAPQLTTSVPPNVIQWTEGVDEYEDTWVEAECRPPWTAEDHYVVK